MAQWEKEERQPRIKILTYNKRYTQERSIFYVTAQTVPCSVEGEGGGGGGGGEEGDEK